MKKTIALFAAALALMFTTSAFAAPPKKVPVKQQFYDMTGSVHDGFIRKPTATWLDGKERARFGSMAHLQKSFFPALHQTAGEVMKLR